MLIPLVPALDREKTSFGRFVRGLAWLSGLLFALSTSSILKAQENQPKLQSIESAIQAARSSVNPVPVVIRGIVILNRHQVVIEDRTGATEVQLLETDQIALGDEVEVTGLMRLSPRPRVEQGHLHRLWGGSMPLPLAVTPDQAAEGENELYLVQLDAKLLDAIPAGLTGVRLNLTGGHQSFSAILTNDGLGGELPAKFMQPGATLRLTGILFVSRDLSGNHGNAFTLQLRTADDVELVEGPSWWTRGHLLLLAGISIILILICINAYSRVTHARYRAVAEERTNIARDIHDTLAQGFAGITLQLEAAERTIERDPQKAQVFLREALQLVRHSRDESHLSIEMLRTPSRKDRLDVLIGHCISQMKAATGAAIEQQVEGEPTPLSFNYANHLFRIGQEAIANAVRHANASQVFVRIYYGHAQVRLEVEDNGRGFDPTKIPGPDEGHFGLTGMRERAAAINSQFQLESTPQGTLVRVMVTL